MIEKELFNRVLDAYARSRHFIDDSLKATNVTISDQSISNIMGIDGRLHYTRNHQESVGMMLNVLFTADYKLFIAYDPREPEWEGERHRDLQVIIRQLTDLFINRLIALIRSNEDLKSQHSEILGFMTKLSCGAASIKHHSASLLRTAIQSMADIACQNSYSVSAGLKF